MLASPIVVGVIAAGPSWAHAPLVATWIVGYFAFFAMSLWLKASRKERYVAPMRAYAVATAVLGLTTLAVEPRLIRWAPLFAVLSGIALFEASRRRDRSLLSGLSTVLAAGAMTFVVMDAGDGLVTRADVARATFLALAQLGYLVGVLLYVKTMIRERNNPRFKAISVGWHVAITLIAAVWAPTHPPAWGLVAVYVVLTIRAAVMPGRPLKPKQVGMAEMPLHALVVAAALVAVMV